MRLCPSEWTIIRGRFVRKIAPITLCEDGFAGVTTPSMAQESRKLVFAGYLGFDKCRIIHIFYLTVFMDGLLCLSAYLGFVSSDVERGYG